MLQKERTLKIRRFQQLLGKKDNKGSRCHHKLNDIVSSDIKKLKRNSEILNWTIIKSCWGKGKTFCHNVQIQINNQNIYQKNISMKQLICLKRNYSLQYRVCHVFPKHKFMLINLRYWIILKRYWKNHIV